MFCCTRRVFTSTRFFEEQSGREMHLSRSINTYLPKLLILFISLIISPSALWACEVKPLVFMWQVPKSISEKTFGEMSIAGVSVIQHFQLTNWSDDEILGYLDRAYRNQLSVLIYLGHVLEHSRSSNPEWRVGEKAGTFIEKWRSHPAVFGWHTFDEPKELSKLATAKVQEDVYRKIKSIDSMHPVVVSSNLQTKVDYDRFFSENAFDILELHAYPNDSNLEREKNLIIGIKTHRSRNYPVWFTLRAFNATGWGALPMDSLARQYELICRVKDVAGIGFYGWKLAPNTGIVDEPGARYQFATLMNEINKLPLAK